MSVKGCVIAQDVIQTLLKNRNERSFDLYCSRVLYRNNILGCKRAEFGRTR